MITLVNSFDDILNSNLLDKSATTNSRTNIKTSFNANNSLAIFFLHLATPMTSTNFPYTTPTKVIQGILKRNNSSNTNNNRAHSLYLFICKSTLINSFAYEEIQ